MVPYIPERYFYVKKDINEQKQGPFALGELKKMDLKETVLIWRYGLYEWIKVCDLIELKMFKKFDNV
ncbi:MAG: hypothetical protein A3K10_06470 [Bacteroidetes bacterium RIFCSPLOWO2_12_FULL_31_6]|nr:MAG: hypothetical protein A3K10_06470 [Bacteroidetes bacterium RIFCSPLOWO2_12_FULL_31_6]